jgi:hypothetical protein
VRLSVPFEEMIVAGWQANLRFSNMAVCGPTIFLLEAINMITAIRGAATRPVENCSPEERLDGIDMHEIKQKTNHSRYCNGRIESDRVCLI